MTSPRRGWPVPLFFIGEVVGIAAHLTGGVDDGIAADRVAAE